LIPEVAYRARKSGVVKKPSLLSPALESDPGKADTPLHYLEGINSYVGIVINLAIPFRSASKVSGYSVINVEGLTEERRRVIVEDGGQQIHR
jgi:hypothetical protein